ncbi:hypothetical protein SEA_GIUSEPPE_81 [Mycobacterium phage Giuseppe]|uniref:Uncharacterized protein n=5 Tax=Plotvirus plot TaxID=2170099 RepID=B5U445_9CAUD|nr:gp79 [Mycobacterium phage Troll4]AER49832.1 hypothetical protein NOVA_79 [Mycobacterium phage Nova]AYN58218.1 hypothetical protein SEA_KANDZ_77 [Mycobacterium phage KandZ]QFG14228.1 hypothetical protein SEA_GIUSEPPE_81 [Mycobacterium phage Giuseppe]QFP96004.1 hypothetical protein SEA_HELPFUL_82 [Mycobacterium phage Helpful]WNN93788.1 hypothetical protein SEA_MOPEY_81 [Mycobacterium phage Mopey]
MRGVKGSGQGTWAARYDSVCSVCPHPIFKGDPVHKVHNKVAHEECHALDERGGFGLDVSGIEQERLDGRYGKGYEDRPSYTVRGRRKHERKCSECFQIHAGECP